MAKKTQEMQEHQEGGITVGVATKKELYSIFILAREYFPYANFSYEEIIRRVDSKKVVYLVARINGRMAGYLDYEMYADHAKILGLAVLEEFRKRGVAKSLVQATLASIQQLGFNRVFLFVAKDNEVAKKLYSDFGFSCFGTLERKINDKDILLFQKLFPPSSNN
jgi:[ribosomal protein S18]-alanine N-acetyltransferase